MPFHERLKLLDQEPPEAHQLQCCQKLPHAGTNEESICNIIILELIDLHACVKPLSICSTCMCPDVEACSLGFGADSRHYAILS